MDLNQLANLGEFIGGVAVLVTLVYLAGQVRSANRELGGSRLRDVMTDYSNWYRQIATAEGARIWAKGTDAYETLDREEEVQFHSLATQLLTTYTRSRIFLSEGTLDREVFDSTERWMTAFLNTSGGSSWWARANSDWIAWAEDLSGQSVFPDRHPLASQPAVSGKDS